MRPGLGAPTVQDPPRGVGTGPALDFAPIELAGPPTPGAAPGRPLFWRSPPMAAAAPATVQSVMDALQQLVDPNTGKDLIAGKSAKNIQVDGGNVSLDVELGYPAKSQVDGIRQMTIEAVRALPGVANVSVNVSVKIVAHAVQRGVKLMNNVRNIIAVASGKGGVGKSTRSEEHTSELQSQR